MNLSKDKVTEIFFFADNFCKEFHKSIEALAIEEAGKVRREPRRKPKMSSGEVITIMVLFHYGAFRNLKHFYIHYVCKHMQGEFPQTVSYNRFVELMEKEAISMAVMLQMFCLGECTGISYVDSTPLRVCKNKRIHNHKVFKGLAQVGKSTMGWFYGFKLHLLLNEKGEILNFVITPGNTDDRDPLKDEAFLKKIKGKLYADKGYISKQLTEILFVDGIHLVTGIKNNMKNILVELKDKILLRKRSVIETVNDELKTMCQIEHSRHRSFTNFLTNTLAAMIAYSFFPKKPAIKFEVETTNQLSLF